MLVGWFEDPASDEPASDEDCGESLDACVDGCAVLWSVLVVIGATKVVDSWLSVVLAASVESGEEEAGVELSPWEDELSSEELLGGAVVED